MDEKKRICGYCGFPVSASDTKCPKCGENFNPDNDKDDLSHDNTNELNNDGSSILFHNEQQTRQSYTKAYLYVAVVILILGFFGGTILGEKYKTKELIYESSISSKYNEYETSFNSTLMMYCWIGTILFDIPIFAIYSVCHRLDLIVDEESKDEKCKLKQRKI